LTSNYGRAGQSQPRSKLGHARLFLARSAFKSALSTDGMEEVAARTAKRLRVSYGRNKGTSIAGRMSVWSQRAGMAWTSKAYITPEELVRESSSRLAHRISGLLHLCGLPRCIDRYPHCPATTALRGRTHRPPASLEQAFPLATCAPGLPTQPRRVTCPRRSCQVRSCVSDACQRQTKTDPLSAFEN